MNQFWIWFSTGIEHILDLQGYDHFLFVTLLVLTFPFNEWRKLFILITAFTIGHSASLACSVIFQLGLPQNLVEFLIALSILITAAYQLINKYHLTNQKQLFVYSIGVGFGLIHGLGFSFQLRALLGHEESVILPLLYFNLGLELGQLIIVLLVVLFSLFLAFVFKCPYKLYKLALLCLISIVALKITTERFLQLFALA